MPEYKPKFSGKASWFGGPNDSMAGSKTASGVGTDVPGVAVRPGSTYNTGQPYLRGYWRITAPNGRSVVIRQTDIGPNESTGRRIDITYSALHKFGYNEKNFPTDAQFHAEYLGKTPKKVSGPVSSGTPGATKTTGFPAQGVTSDPSARKAALNEYITQRHFGGQAGNVGGLQRTLQGLEQPVGAPAEAGIQQPAPAGGVSGFAAVAAQRANQINAKKLPYQWGGGHGGRVNPATAKPLDCSGAVSAVLGIDPRVSGQFQGWGHAGDGGNKGVTVYSNNHHVFMKINGHFFGTSASNPGGGAGWIPQGKISPEYLKGFTVRHTNA